MGPQEATMKIESKARLPQRERPGVENFGAKNDGD